MHPIQVGFSTGFDLSCMTNLSPPLPEFKTHFLKFSTKQAVSRSEFFHGEFQEIGPPNPSGREGQKLAAASP
jgi:hypothetical protein